MANVTRGPGLTRTGKTRRRVQCIPPNQKCGGRCIPPDWECQLEGKGTNSALKVVKNDPLAGAAAIQRGAKDVAKGVATLDPATVQRGRSSIIRGIVKVAPGNSLEEKNKLRKQLEEGSSAAFALTLVGILGIVGHKALNKSSFYKARIGNNIDRAALRAVNAVLDVTPGKRGPRNAIRAAATVAQIQTMRSAQRGYALTTAGQRATGNLGRIGPLGFLGNRVGANNSPLLSDAKLRGAMQTLANNASNADDFASKATAKLFSTTTTGSHNLFSASSTHTFLNSEYRLRLGAVVNPPLQRRMGGSLVDNPAAALTLTSRKEVVIEGLTSRIQQWGGTMRADMRLRGYTEAGQLITPAQINRYIQEQALPIVRPYASRMGPNANVALSNYERQIRNFIGAGDSARSARGLARQTYLSTMKGYDSYFNDVVDRFSGGAMGRSSPFADGKVALAKYLRGSETYAPARGRGYTRIVSREHADLLVRDWYHRRGGTTSSTSQGSRIRTARASYIVTPGTTRRIAQSMQRASELPDPESALIALRRSGLQVRYASPVEPRTSMRDRTQAQQLASMMQQMRVNRSGERVPRYASRASALRVLRAQQQETNRGDVADLEQVGKPCGESSIPKEKKCHKKRTVRITASQISKAVMVGAYATYSGVSIHRAMRSTDINTKINNAVEHAKAGTQTLIKSGNYRMRPTAFASSISQLKGQPGVNDKVIDQVAAFITKSKINVNMKPSVINLSGTAGFWNPSFASIINVPYFNKPGMVPAVDYAKVANAGRSHINQLKPLGLFRRHGVSSGVSFGSAEQFKLTTIHELGHAIHGRSGFATPRKLTFNGKVYEGAALTRALSRSITSYGKTDLRYGRYETFAEYFSMYVTSHDSFKRRNPVAWAWTKSIVDNSLNKASGQEDKLTLENRANIGVVIGNTKKRKAMFDSAEPQMSAVKLYETAVNLALEGKTKELTSLIKLHKAKLTADQYLALGSLYETSLIYAFTKGDQQPMDDVVIDDPTIKLL